MDPTTHRIDIHHQTPYLGKGLNLNRIRSWPYLDEGHPVGWLPERQFGAVSLSPVLWLTVVGVQAGTLVLTLEHGMELSNNLVVELELVRLVLKC